MPAIYNLDTNFCEYRSEDDANCHRKLNDLIRENPDTLYYIDGLQYGSYSDWLDPAVILKDYCPQ